MIGPRGASLQQAANFQVGESAEVTVSELLFPICGCDACDESWEHQATELEWQVLAVAGGGLRERRLHGGDREFQSALSAVDGSASHGFGTRLIELWGPERIQAAAETLAAHPEGWAAWPSRVPAG